MPPAKPGGRQTPGGLIGKAISRRATHRIALSEGAWLDLARDGKAVPSTAHSHGPPRSGVSKMVDFVLTPGAAGCAGSRRALIRMLVAGLP
jgi:hypothetical protein